MAFAIGDRIGDYQVIGELGKGGMARVYKVRNTISEQVQAMKVMLPDLASDSEYSERFLREMKVLARMHHPGIAALHTALRVQNQLVMIMELVEGVTLADLLARGQIPLKDCVEYIGQALSALGYAHGMGVIHRDIKPANMMRTPEGTIKLMDFGVAKTEIDRRVTTAGSIVGSLFYMSPEQLMGRDLDARSDLYSVGVTLYELTTSVPPFYQGGALTLFGAQLHQTPTPPALMDPNIPPALNEIILRALEKDPAKRFQTAEEFRVALARVAVEQKTVPAPGSPAIGGRPSQPAETSPPAQAVTPLPVTPPSPTDQALSSPHPPAPIVSRRGWYMALGVILAVALIAVLAAELHDVLVNRRGQARTASSEGSFRGTSTAPPPSLAFPSGDMVLVAGGEALLGEDRHPVSVKSFYIDRTEVTNGAYLMFCRETNHALPKGLEEAPADYPVVNITFYEAHEFALWAQKRLPSALEWEKAARGTKGQIYPWGNDLRFEFANIPRSEAATKSGRLAPATAYASGASPYGALNMLGNVWEWVDTPAEVPTGSHFENYRKTFFSDLVPALSPTEPFYQVRGGSYHFYSSRANDPSVLLWAPMPIPARGSQPDIGFRCARDVDR
jgi:serine/threonine-protein kinase